MIKFGLPSVLGLVFCGCATILQGSSQVISVNSNVDGAQVYLAGELLGSTPFSGEVERGAVGTLAVKAEGYQDFTFALNREISTVFWLNIFVGGVLGSATDLSTDALYEYEPSTFQAELRPLNASVETQARSAKVAVMRRFLLMNGEPLARQIAEGQGHDLESLYRGLEIPESERDRYLTSWRAAYADSSTAIEFSDRMLSTMNL